ncbi:hypothetical protein HaLaN_29854 [Haematococcus lacustris]|uniref:Uncharacterized protein n=1 Tax=Haematococcus lacustris TaxID=44745 RepID=A0A6A0ADY1_HAELA|nr:hypothetical protein HaLaN_29854 [Haematococcus lacustris]
MQRNRQRKRNRNASNIEVDRELEAQAEQSQAQKNKKASGEARRDRHDENTWHAKKARIHTHESAARELATGSHGARLLCRGLPPPHRQRGLPPTTNAV